jgi:heparan-alpha-glucosaminide N-acetyltransferase
MSAASRSAPASSVPSAAPATTARITSIDALRGLVMFTMIFVNDIAGVSPKIVPPWMRHFHGRSGMTFVDLVFPAFLFIVGMSIPLALGGRLDKGQPVWKVFAHVVVRTLSLLLIGILMVNDESSDSAALGWSSALWSVLMFTSAILAFSSISTGRRRDSTTSGGRLPWAICLAIRVLGFAGLLVLALAFRGKGGQRIVTLSPFVIHTSWYGILGLIGWAYLVGSLVFLIFRSRPTALLGCAVLLLCLYAADKTNAFDGFWLGRYVGLDSTLGSQPSITVAGILLASALLAPEGTVAARFRFTLLFVAGFAAGAWLLTGLYGINKNQATPSWCLWSCAITAALWLALYYVCDVNQTQAVARPLAIAGQNVFLAYLLSEMLPSALELVGWDNWYDRLAGPDLFHAVARSAACAVLILAITAGLNRTGFRLRL